MSDRPILGIDPGCSGALAFIFPGVTDRVAVEDTPVIAKAVAPGALVELIRRFDPCHAYVERVAANGANGSIGNFSLGRAYGAVEAALCALGVPWTAIESKDWKKPHRIVGGDAGKEQARLVAQRLFPLCSAQFVRVKDHGRADAALIALHGLSLKAERRSAA